MTKEKQTDQTPLQTEDAPADEASSTGDVSGFDGVQLPAYLAAALTAQGFTALTDIQAKCIPAMREGRDLIGSSQTGSGKTYAFGIPAVESIDADPYVQVLVICPTRELAGQVCDELRKLTVGKEGCKVVPLVGGNSMERQIFALKKSARIVVGTPGRLMDHLRRRTLKLKHVKLVVLDEADEMLDMGFCADIEEILRQSNPARQTVLFSATMPPPILQLAEKFLRDPLHLSSDTYAQAQTFIKQFYVSVPRDKKTEATVELLHSRKPQRAIVFCNTKRMAEELTQQLQSQGIAATGLHGDMRQRDRRTALNEFKRDGCGVLVATDVAARGIDVADVDAVINYDIPSTGEAYVHRIGRTARAGKTGEAYTVVSGKAQMGLLDALRRTTRNSIDGVELSCSMTFATPPPPQKRGQKQAAVKPYRKQAKTARDKGAPKGPRGGKPQGRRSPSQKPRAADFYRNRAPQKK